MKPTIPKNINDVVDFLQNKIDRDQYTVEYLKNINFDNEKERKWKIDLLKHEIEQYQAAINVISNTTHDIDRTTKTP